MLPAGQDAAEAFYRITDAAYERRSVAVTSNIHPSGFDTIMPKTLATATVDRLMHHAHLVLTKGDSHRLAEALAGVRSCHACNQTRGRTETDIHLVNGLLNPCRYHGAMRSLNCENARTTGIFTLFEGTSEIQRMIIGQAVTGLDGR